MYGYWKRQHAIVDCIELTLLMDAQFRPRYHERLCSWPCIQVCHSHETKEFVTDISR